MADFDLGGLLSGGGGLYDDLLTPQQRDQLSSRGLLSMAGALADAAMPSRFPVPLGAAIGKAAAAMGSGRDQAAMQVLQAQKLAQEVQTQKITSALQQQFMKDIQTLPLDVLFKRYGIGTGGVPAAAAPSVLPGAALASPAAPPTTAPLPAAAAALPDIGAAAASAAGEYGGGQAPTGLLGTAPSLPPGDVPPPEPPLKASSLGAPDTVLPSGPGGLLATPAMYGGGAGTPPFGPGGEPTVRLAASSGGERGPLLPGADISFIGPPGPGAPGWPAGKSPPDPKGPGGERDPRELIPYIRERAIANGIDPDVAVRVAQSEGLRSFQSSIIRRDGTREPSYGAMQLYTGGGMGNDFQRDTGLDPSDPKNERATIDYALSKAPSTGWTKWHGAAGAGIGPRTGLPGGPDYVVPSGRGIPANMLQQVADKGAAPGAPGAPDGQGMNTLLLELAKRNAMAEILKLGNPYSSMLSVLQGSPEYKGQIAGAEAKATQPYTQENATHASQLKILEDMAKDNMTVDKNGNIVLLPEAQRIRTMNAEQQAEAKAKWEAPVEQPVYSPDGTIKIEKMNTFEFRRRADDKARRAALGDTMPRPGDLAQTPYYRPGQAEQETAAGAPQHIGPTDTVVYPPGSVGASRYQNAKMRGQALPDNVAIQPDGSVRVSGGYTPGQVKTQESAATNTQTRINGYQEAANAAQSAKTTLQGISGEIGKVVTGPFADYAQNAALYLNTIAPGFSGQVKAYEDMASQANELVRKAVRASDPNPSFVQTRMAMDSMPIPSKSEGGLYKITNRMIGLQDHDIARGNATQMETPGGAEKFDSWWRQNVSPYAFVFAKLAPDDRDSLINTLQKTAQGKRELETIGKQLQFIEQHGGFGVR